MQIQKSEQSEFTFWEKKSEKTQQQENSPVGAHGSSLLALNSLYTAAKLLNNQPKYISVLAGFF